MISLTANPAIDLEPPCRGSRMKILNIRTITGPNVYSHQPVLVVKFDLEHLADKESV